jgi:DNA-binding NarL/FixJ family response regulator
VISDGGWADIARTAAEIDGDRSCGIAAVARCGETHERRRMNAAVTCVIADDHPVMLAAVADILTTHGMQIVGRARDGQEALTQIEDLRPKVALVDIRMPRLSGIDVANRVAAGGSETAVIFYTAYGDRALLAEALDAGVRGFVLKEAPLGDLVRAVESVAAGETYVDPVLAGVLASAQMTDRLPALTQREREVLRLLADGLSNEEIGKRLFISPETVRTHVRKAMAKLEADTRTQAVAKALRQSLIA